MAQPLSTSILADVLGSSGGPVSIGTSYAAGATSPAIDAKDYKFIRFSLILTSAGSATELYWQYETSPTGGAAATEWAPETTENVSSGAAEQFNYEPVEKNRVAGVAAATLIRRPILPVRGARYIRIKLKADAACSGYVQYSLSGGPV